MRGIFGSVVAHQDQTALVSRHGASCSFCVGMQSEFTSIHHHGLPLLFQEVKKTAVWCPSIALSHRWRMFSTGGNVEAKGSAFPC